MDFSEIELDAEHSALLKEILAFVEEHITDEVRQYEIETGHGFNEKVHLALGEHGWIMPQWPREQGGADMDALGIYLLTRELSRAKMPTPTASTTRLAVTAVEKFGSPEIKQDVLRGVADGTVRISLGYTEPHGGSDVAMSRTRAVKDGNEWVINGSKMFTTGAQNTQYCFLIARSDPSLPKHKGLSMFLLPMDLPGIEIQPLRAFSGERTNMVFFDDVRVPERYLLGEPNGGWTVLRGPLDAEHGNRGDATEGLRDLSMAASFIQDVHEGFETVLDWADAESSTGRPADDPRVLERIGRLAMEMDASLVTPGPAGRIKGGETTVWAGAEMLDLLGPEGLIDFGHDEALGGGVAEYVNRFAQGTITYGGSVEVFRTIIAQHELGLPRMDYPGSRAFVTSAS
jgi:3-oxocholest-4-en-26-oyl-CoA dehydrogenase alpha subunit